MCLPRTVRVLESDALPIVQEQGWFAPMPNDWNGGFVDFMLEQDDHGITPNGAQEVDHGITPNGAQEVDDGVIPYDIGEYGLLGPEDGEIDRMWNVYRGVDRPRDDDDWYACWKFVTDSLSDVTGVTFEFKQWENAWSDSDDSSVDGSD